MKNIIVLLLMSVFFSACEYGKFTNVEKIKQRYTFNIYEDDNFTKIAEKRASEIAESLLDLNIDEGESFVVTKVNVNDVNVEFTYAEGNTAKSLGIILLVTSENIVEEKEFANISPNIIELAGSDWQPQIISQFAISQWLNTDGVNRIKETLESILLNTNTFDGTGLTIRLDGGVNKGEVFSGNVTVELEIDVEYSTCQRVPFGFAAESCSSF